MEIALKSDNFVILTTLVEPNFYFVQYFLWSFWPRWYRNNFINIIRTEDCTPKGRAPFFQQFTHGVVQEGVIADICFKKCPQTFRRILALFPDTVKRTSAKIPQNFRKHFRKNPFANDPISEPLILHPCRQERRWRVCMVSMEAHLHSRQWPLQEVLMAALIWKAAPNCQNTQNRETEENSVGLERPCASQAGASKLVGRE